MEIKQDLIMNFDFRTYCANFFAGQSKTAAEVVAEFERITHTTELFQIEPRAEDRLFILDADGLKAADGATFLFVAGRNMRVSYDNERKDIDINDAASIEMSVLQELSWNVDLYTDSWGYQVEGQGVYNFLANQSQFLELTDEEYNNDNITKPDFTLNIEGKNNSTTQDTSYAIPHFLWNTHLIYNSGDKEAVGNFAYTFNKDFKYPISLGFSNTSDRFLWGYGQNQKVLFDNFSDKNPITNLSITKQDTQWILTISTATESKTINFNWTNPNLKIYVFKIAPALVEDIPNLHQTLSVLWKSIDENSATEIIGDVDNSNLCLNITQRSDRALQDSIDLQQRGALNESYNLDQNKSQPVITYHSFEITDGFSLNDDINWIPVPEQMRNNIFKNGQCDYRILLRNGTNTYKESTLGLYVPPTWSGAGSWEETEKNAINTRFFSWEGKTSLEKIVYNFTWNGNYIEGQGGLIHQNEEKNIAFNFIHTYYPFYGTCDDYYWYCQYGDSNKIFTGNGCFYSDVISLWDIPLSSNTTHITHSGSLDTMSFSDYEVWKNGELITNNETEKQGNIVLKPIQRQWTIYDLSNRPHTVNINRRPSLISVSNNIQFISNDRYVVMLLNPNDIGDIIDTTDKKIYIINETDTSLNNIHSSFDINVLGMETTTISSDTTEYQFPRQNSNIIQFAIKEHIVNGFGIKEINNTNIVYDTEQLDVQDNTLQAIDYNNSVSLTWKRKFLPVSFNYNNTPFTFFARINNQNYENNVAKYLWLPYNKISFISLTWPSDASIDLFNKFYLTDAGETDQKPLLKDNFNLDISAWQYPENTNIPWTLSVVNDDAESFSTSLTYDFTLQKQGSVYLLRIDGLTFNEDYISASLYFGINSSIKADENGIRTLIKDKPTNKTFFQGLFTTVSLTGQSAKDTQMALLVTYQTHNGKTLYGITTFNNIVMYDGDEHTWNGTAQLVQAVIDD